jgi:hypothetical protein
VHNSNYLNDVKSTVASRSKILQNNSKPAEKRKRMAGNIGRRIAADLRQKRRKIGRKKYFMKNMLFCMKC